MATFKYVARDAVGNRVEDKIDATDQASASSALKRLNLTVLSISPEKGGLFSMQLGGSKDPKPRVSGVDLVVFTRQFSTMIGAGLPVMECLDILAEQADDPGFKACLYKVCNDVRSGNDLSQSLSRHPRVFSDIYVNMIKAGEASGQLDTILSRLAEYMESTESLKRKIKSAMTYPVISLCMIFGITGFLLVFIIPKFQKIFENMGVELPLPTVIVLKISWVLTNSWYYIIAGLVATIVGIIQFKKTTNGRYVWDSLMLKMPVFGGLFQKVAISRFARTFATLLRSGVAILGALDIVSQTAGNAVLEEAVSASREAIRQGETLAKPLADSPIFPPMVVRMIQVGERSGALETLLEKISEFYDDQVDATVEALTSLIEPLMIGLMGAIVGTIVLSVFLPIFKMQQAIGH
ncbi:MAG: type II secretion system F family protein [Planctomycetes bacterium]|nr:type II secretion system F family protein [Planctomycetota bacterium]